MDKDSVIFGAQTNKLSVILFSGLYNIVYIRSSQQVGEEYGAQ
jgi:hypothetical protein